MTSTKRIIGIDIARALAIFGMIIVNFKVVLGETGWSWVEAIVQVLEGKAAATFVVLAGLGIALMTNTARRSQNADQLRLARTRLGKRALFLFLLGLSYLPIWPADILHFYGVYMLILLFYLRASNQWILGSAVGLIFLYPVMLLLWDYEAGWNFETLTYTGFWTWSGFFRNLLYNGFHPVFPWTTFMLVGFWLGKQDLRDTPFLKRVFGSALFVFLSIQGLSGLGAYFLPEGELLFSTSPMPPLPLYMLSGLSCSLVIISACIMIGYRWPDLSLLSALRKTGQLALTFYVAHVVLGMGLLEGLFPERMGLFPVQFSLLYAILFSLVCVGFAILWTRYKKAGPLEWLMRKITG